MGYIEYKNKKIEISDETAENLMRAVEEPKPWKPRVHERYWFVEVNGGVRSNIWTDITADNERYEIGNVFPTKEAAQNHVRYLKALTTVKQYIEANDLGGDKVVIIWVDSHFMLDYDNSKSASPFGKLKSMEAAEQLIDDCEEELKIIFGVS